MGVGADAAYAFSCYPLKSIQYTYFLGTRVSLPRHLLLTHSQTHSPLRCGPCQMIAPHFQAMADENPNVTFVKVDVDAMDKIAQMCGVRAMPTFQFFKGGEKVDEMCGANVAGLKAKVASLA